MSVKQKLKFAGAYKGQTCVIKDVHFVEGEAAIVGSLEQVSSLVAYLATFQALPVEEADALQKKLDLEVKVGTNVEALVARAEAAEADAEAARKELADGLEIMKNVTVEDNDKPTGRSGDAWDSKEDPKSKSDKPRKQPT